MTDRINNIPSLKIAEATPFRSLEFAHLVELDREDISDKHIQKLKLTRTKGLNALKELIDFNPDCQDLFDAFKGLANGLILIANSRLNQKQGDSGKRDSELERSGMQSLSAAYGAYFKMRSSPLIASEQTWDEESMAFYLLSAHSEMARVVDRATRAVKTANFDQKALIDAIEALESCSDFLKSAKPIRC